MHFRNPIVVYTAVTNVEAHLVVEMLIANGIPAHAVEDQSGVSLWMFGTISQFHQPNVWVDESQVESALQLIQQFEERKRERVRKKSDEGTGKIDVQCEECGETTVFPSKLDGTTQDCSHCHAYVDVGQLPWGGTNDEWGE